MPLTPLRGITVAGVLALSLAVAGPARAGGYPWLEHAAPFDFAFGNHIDSHQQSQLLEADELQGFLYIDPGGEVGGIPVARPGTEAAGWVLHGVPGTATFGGLHEGHHPVWLVEAADRPRQAGYVHFHWVGAPQDAPGLVVGQVYPGFFLKLTAISTFLFMHHGELRLVTPGIDFNFEPNIETAP